MYIIMYIIYIYVHGTDALLLQVEARDKPNNMHISNLKIARYIAIAIAII